MTSHITTILQQGEHIQQHCYISHNQPYISSVPTIVITTYLGMVVWNVATLWNVLSLSMYFVSQCLHPAISTFGRFPLEKFYNFLFLLFLSYCSKLTHIAYRARRATGVNCACYPTRTTLWVWRVSRLDVGMLCPALSARCDNCWMRTYSVDSDCKRARLLLSGTWRAVRNCVGGLRTFQKRIYLVRMVMLR